jgi:hypothetical protein
MRDHDREHHREAQHDADEDGGDTALARAFRHGGHASQLPTTLSLRTRTLLRSERVIPGSAAACPATLIA